MFRHGPLVFPRWSDPKSGKHVDKTDGRPSTTDYRRVLQGQEVEDKEVCVLTPHRKAHRVLGDMQL